MLNPHSHHFKPTVDELSKREIEVLELAGQSLTNKEISEKLGIELSTVKRHFCNICNKLGVEKRIGALSIYYQFSLTENDIPKIKKAMPGLSDKDVQIVYYVCQRKTAGEIGQILDIEKNTIKSRIHDIRQKFGIPNHTGIFNYIRNAVGPQPVIGPHRPAIQPSLGVKTASGPRDVR